MIIIFSKKKYITQQKNFLTIKKKDSDAETWIISTFHLAHQVCKVDISNIT